MDGEVDRIAEVFVGRNILITGGSGFLGKVLIEKLLRDCSDIEKIYLLVRTKKGKSAEDRLVDIFSNPIFDLVKKIRGTDNVMDQCKIISGDVSEANLGLSNDDRELLINKISIIYHCAATIRFDEALRKAVMLNTRGTRSMLNLGKECKHLDLFCYVSTAYCHLNEKLLLEKPYPPPADPHKIIKTCEWLNEEVIDSMTKKILGSLPNTYAFTKALAEGLVVEKMNEMPCIILRPSIVIPIFKEPLPGWTDNINGPTGLLIGAGKGVIRTMYCNSTGYGDFLPVDIAVNGILVSTWNYIANKDHKRNVLNMVSSAEIKLSWNDIVDMGRNVVATKIPLNGVLWYPGGSMKSNRLHHNISSILYHWIPAYCIDFLLFILGYPPVLCRVHTRISKGFEVFEYYANNQWDFDNTNGMYLRKILNPTEKMKYKIDSDDVDVEKYFEQCIRAARWYILKESDESIPAARRHMRIMWWVDKICKYTIVALFLYFIFGFIFSSLFAVKTVQESIVDTI